MEEVARLLVDLLALKPSVESFAIYYPIDGLGAEYSSNGGRDSTRRRPLHIQTKRRRLHKIGDGASRVDTATAGAMQRKNLG